MNVVSVMAHQDDELVCLGTLSRMRDRGDLLHFICVTDGSGGMAHSPRMTREEAAAIRDREMSELARRLDASYRCLAERDEYLYDTPSVRERLIEALRACQAEVVFTHFHTDYNLDHTTVNRLVRQCAMQAPLPMIDTASAPLAAPPAVFQVEPSGGFGFEPSHYVDISTRIDFMRKLIGCHRSQDEAFRIALGKGLDDWVLETSRYRGVQSGVEYAEGFMPMLSRGFIKPYPILP